MCRLVKFIDTNRIAKMSLIKEKNAMRLKLATISDRYLILGVRMREQGSGLTSCIFSSGLFWAGVVIGTGEDVSLKVKFSFGSSYMTRSF